MHTICITNVGGAVDVQPPVTASRDAGTAPGQSSRSGRGALQPPAQLPPNSDTPAATRDGGLAAGTSAAIALAVILAALLALLAAFLWWRRQRADGKAATNYAQAYKATGTIPAVCARVS